MKRRRTEATRQFYVGVGTKIAIARTRLGITQEALASDIALTRTAVVNIENGKQQLLLHTLVKISRVLKVPFSDLIPELPADETPSLEVMLAKLVPDQRGRAWIENSLEKTDGHPQEVHQERRRTPSS